MKEMKRVYKRILLVVTFSVLCVVFCSVNAFAAEDDYISEDTVSMPIYESLHDAFEGEVLKPNIEIASPQVIRKLHWSQFLYGLEIHQKLKCMHAMKVMIPQMQ